MATKIEEFELWEFTDDEEAVAFVFTELQLKYLRSERTVVLQERATLAVDPESPNAQLKFLLESEYYRGKYEQLNHLITTSENKSHHVVELLRQKTESQEKE